MLTLVLLCVPFDFAMSGKTEFERFYDTWKERSSEDLSEQGVKALRKGDMELALTFFNMIVKRYDNDAPKSSQDEFIRAYLNAGSIYYSEYSDNQQAYNCFMRVLDISRRFGMTKYYAYAYANIGNIYMDLEDTRKGMTCYLKALTYSLKGRDWYVSALVSSNVFSVALKYDEWSRCRHVINMLEKARIPDTDPSGRYINAYCRVLRDMLDKRYAEALAGFDRLAGMADKSLYETPASLSAMIHSNKAHLYSDLGRYDEALAECRITEKLVLDGNVNKQELKETYILVSHILRKKGEMAQAYDYLQKAYSCIDDNEGKMHRSKVNGMQSLYNLNQKNDEIDAIVNEGKTRNMIMIALMSAVIGLTVVVVLVLRNGKNIKKKNRLIYQKNMELFDKSKADYERIMSYERSIQSLNAELDRLKGLAAKDTEHAAPDAADAGDGTADTGNGGTDKATADEEENEKYGNSKLSEAEALSMMNKVLMVMETDSEIFSPDFSIDRLAALVDSKPKYVSQVVNSCSKKNFRLFLAEYRVREACKRFSNKDVYGGYTIEALATSVGFNSRSAFITAFKRITGITPSEYMNVEHGRTA